MCDSIIVFIWQNKKHFNKCCTCIASQVNNIPANTETEPAGPATAIIDAVTAQNLIKSKSSGRYLYRKLLNVHVFRLRIFSYNVLFLVLIL